MAGELLREMIRGEFDHVNTRLNEIREDVKELRKSRDEDARELAKQSRDIRTLFNRVGGERSRLTFYCTLIVGGATGLYWLLKVVKVL